MNAPFDDILEYRAKNQIGTLIATIFFLVCNTYSVKADGAKTIEELFMNSLIADAIYVDFPTDPTKFRATLDNN